MTDDYLIASGILLFAYLIRGITGFGSGLIAIPLLAHLLPLPFVVPMVLVVDTLASILMTRHARLDIRWDEIRALVPASIAGMFIGAFLLVELPHEPLMIGLACFVMLFGIRYVLDIHGESAISRWWSIPTGLSGGTIGAMFGTGGPPYVVYLGHRLHDKSQLRGTLSGLFMLEGGLRIAIFLIIGLFAQDGMLESILIAVPAMLAGLYIGNHVHMGITRRVQYILIGILLILSSMSLLWKVWFQ